MKYERVGFDLYLRWPCNWAVAGSVFRFLPRLLQGLCAVRFFLNAQANKQSAINNEETGSPNFINHLQNNITAESRFSRILYL